MAGVLQQQSEERMLRAAVAFAERMDGFEFSEMVRRSFGRSRIVETLEVFFVPQCGE